MRKQVFLKKLYSKLTPVKNSFLIFVLLILLRPFISDIISTLLTDLIIFAVFIKVILNLFKVKISFRKVRYFLRQVDWLKVFLALVLILFFYYLLNLQSNLDTAKERITVLENKLGGAEKVACTEKDSIEKIRKSVVRIIGGEAEGSGFAVDTDLILTNFHVIELEPSPKIIFSDNTFETAEIIAADKDADLALLKVNKKLNKVTFGNPSKLESSEELLAIGYPLGGDLKGEASVNRGFLAGRRYSKDLGIEFIQIDATLNPGVSGGPLIDVCGRVIGVNTAGMAGLGMAISSDSIMDKWGAMMLSENPLKDVSKVTIDPDKSPADAVAAFYTYLKIRKLPMAFELLSDNFKKGYSYDHWVSGYKDLLDTTVLSISNGDTKNTVKVKLSTKNFTDGEIVYKYFEGTWEVREVKNQWLLWEANIKEVKKPGYLWFHE